MSPRSRRPLQGEGYEINQKTEPGKAHLLACPDCDLLQRHDPVASAGAAHCSRCHAVVRPSRHTSLDRPLALALACAQALIVANVFPLVSLDMRGDLISTTLPHAAWMLYEQHMGLLALLVLLTVVVAPAIHVGALLILLICLRLQFARDYVITLLRLVRGMAAWGMIDVLMLGMLVALVKLAALAAVIPGVALWALGALLVLLAALNSSFNAPDLRRWLDHPVS
jgi:paraquat-inducible protein A